MAKPVIYFLGNVIQISFFLFLLFNLTNAADSYESEFKNLILHLLAQGLTSSKMEILQIDTYGCTEMNRLQEWHLNIILIVLEGLDFSLK